MEERRQKYVDDYRVDMNVFYVTATGRISVDQIVVPLLRNVRRIDKGKGILLYSTLSGMFDCS